MVVPFAVLSREDCCARAVGKRRHPVRLWPVTDTDTIIIGAGPIGLELAVVLRQLGTDYLQIEAGQIGQTITWYPRQVRFFSSPERIAISGVPLWAAHQEKASREQYLAYLRGVVEQFDLAINTYEAVNEIHHAGGRFTVTTNKQVHTAWRVVLAIGDMHHPRMLGINGEDLPHVSHYFDEPHRYFRQRLLVVGGRNSAVEAAIRCCRAGARVTISHRHQKFDSQSIKYWLLPELESLIRAGRIEVRPCTVPIAINQDCVLLQQIANSQNALSPSNTSKKPDVVRADFVLLLTGYEMDSTLFEMAGVELAGENRAPVHNPDTMETNVPGLYVAGTAAAGNQVRFRLFIENCHPHVSRIARSITGCQPPAGLVNDAALRYELPES